MNKKRFQLIRFNPIGRDANSFGQNSQFGLSFQLIRFNPIGRVKYNDHNRVRPGRFQLIRFNPIGRVCKGWFLERLYSRFPTNPI